MPNSAADVLRTPRVVIPFAAVDPEVIETTVDALLADAEAGLAAIRRREAPLTLEGTLGALEAATAPLEFAVGLVAHLESVTTTDALRAAYDSIQPKVSAFYAQIPLDAELYSVLRDFSTRPEAETLDPTRKRWLQKTLDDFRRHGAELGADAKKRLAELDIELAKTTTKFAQAVVDASAAFELIVEDESRLSGLPDSAKAAARASAEKKDSPGWRFTLQGPSIIPALRYLDDRELREQLWHAYNTRASGGERDNRVRIAKILELRREKANLLGFENFADLVLQDRMAGSGARARAFVDDLRARTESASKREHEELVAFRRELEGDDAPEMRPWDVGYYAEKLRQQRYDFDEELLRPYFALEPVLRGMFELVERLYGVRVHSIDLESWHPDVRTYAIEEADGHRLGVFHVDLHPRESKRDGAWMNSLLTGEGRGEGRLTPHVGLICGNMNEPVGDEPALLTHREVETLFHEFGHLLHHLLTRVEVKSLAGTNVAWDFVELPSQIMENWCWERECLDLFARHWETGETIPEELFAKMTAARTFRAAAAQMRQLCFADVDLALHCEYDARKPGESDEAAAERVMRYARARMAEFDATRLPEDYAMICGFTHLFASPVAYAAGYYSYKWAEVLDADAFSVFKREGIFSREVGERFRETLLSRGDSADPMELFVAFVGREPRVDALLARTGLMGASAA